MACRAPGEERISRGGGGDSGALGLDLHTASVAGLAATGRKDLASTSGMQTHTLVVAQISVCVCV